MSSHSCKVLISDIIFFISGKPTPGKQTGKFDNQTFIIIITITA